MLNERKLVSQELIKLYILDKYKLNELKDWQYCKLSLKNNIPEPFYSHFIMPLSAFIDDNKNIYIFNENHKILLHVEIRYSDIIKNIINSFYKEIKSIIYLKEEVNLDSKIINKNNLNQDNEMNQKQISLWNYDLFYPSERNYSELTKLIQLDKYFRPIYIYGSHGSGKTSLAKTWKNIHQNKLFYTTISDFISEFIISIKKRNVVDYLLNIKNHQILILDDIQNLKPSAKKFQEEIKLLIDYFHQNNKVLVFLSDRDIHFLNLDKSLLSRFLTFHKIHLYYPDYKTKIKIIEFYLKKYNIELNQNMIHYLAVRLNGDVRYIQSSIEKLALSTNHPNQLKISDINYLLSNYFQNPENIDIDTIIEIVCQHFKVDKDEILSSRKQKKISMARHIIAYFSVKLAGKTLSYVAKYIKRKDHTGVLYAIHKVEELIERDLFFQTELENIKEKIWNYYQQNLEKN